MKPSSVRIGNILKWKDNGQIFNVTIGMVKDRYFWEHIKEGDIIAIPFSQKWALEFGFEKQSDFYQYNIEIEYNYKIVIACMFENRTFGIEDANGDMINLRLPDYVNDIQNLYFGLTGKEFAYKLVTS